MESAKGTGRWEELSDGILLAARPAMESSKGDSSRAEDLFERLSPRQQECLRRVYRRKTSKEIATELGLGVGTVDTYITEAISTLQARNRRHAAELLHAFEAAAGTPRKFELENTGVVESRPDRTSGSSEARPLTWLQSLPFRTKGVPFNDLSPFLRFFWIAQLGIALAVGFGMLAVGLEVLSRILR